MAQGRKTGGRQKGTPNRTTVEIREALAAFTSANVSRMSEWLHAVEDPARKLELLLRALEYVTPKQSRQELAADAEGTLLDALRAINAARSSQGGSGR